MPGQNLSEDRALKTQFKVLLPHATKAAGSPEGPPSIVAFFLKGEDSG
jgi:hypothetical protein